MMTNEKRINLNDLGNYQLIRRKKVAQLIGFSERTLDKKTREGTFPTRYIIGRSVYYRLAEVIEYIEKLRIET